MRGKRIAAIAALLFGASAGLLWAEDKIPAIEDIMEAHHAKDGTLDKIAAGVSKDEPDWDKVQELTKEYAKEIPNLGKNKHPEGKGSDKLWKELTTKIADSAKKLDEQAKKKDKEGVAKAVANIKPDQCKKCHDTFRD
jgi:cytochrome c556